MSGLVVMLKKNILRRLLKNFINQYLANPLTKSQLELGEGGGIILSNLALNPQMFNRYLPDAYEVISGDLNIFIDIQHFLEAQKLRIRLSDLNMIIGKSTGPRAVIQEVEPPTIETDVIKEISHYSMEGYEDIAKDVQRIINEKEIHLENVTLEFRSFSNIKQRDMHLIVRVPSVQIEHFDPGQKKATTSQQISLPDEFEVFLYDPQEETRTMIADGPLLEGIGSENIAHSTIRAILQETSHSFDIRLRSFRGAMDPETLQILFDLLDLSPAEKEDSATEDVRVSHENQPAQEKEGDEFVDPQEVFVDVDTFEENEEFYDFEDFEDCDEISDSMLPGDVFSTILPKKTEPPPTAVSYEITFTINQATFTLLPTRNSVAVASIFCGKFDINRLIVPPYAPFDHTTLYLADLSAELFSSAWSLNGSVNVSTFGVTHFKYNGEPVSQIPKERFWNSDSFEKIDILSIQRRNISDEANPIFIKFKKHQMGTCNTCVDIELQEFNVVADNSILVLLPYLNLLSKFQSSDDTPVEPPRLVSIPDSFETEVEQSADVFKLSISTTALSVRIPCSSMDNEKKGILIDIEDVWCSSETRSFSVVQEFMIRFQKLDISTYCYDNVLSFFHCKIPPNAVPVSVVFKQPELLTDSKPVNPNASFSTELVDDYGDMDFCVPKKDSDGGAENYPLPFIQSKKFFQDGKQRNPTIQDEEILYSFKDRSKAESSVQIKVQLLENSYIEIYKENYDLLLVMIPQILEGFTKHLPPANPSAVEKESSSPATTMICQMILQSGSFTLRENSMSSLSVSMEEDVNSSFQGFFKNFECFLVTNYQTTKKSYLHTTIGQFELKDNSPALPKSQTIIQQPGFSANDEKSMFATVLELGDETTMIISECNNISIQYRLGCDWPTRLQNFFVVPGKNNNKPEVPSDKLSETLFFLNLNNVTLDYFPYLKTSKFACIFLLKEGEGHTNPIRSGSTAPLEFHFHSTPDLYLLDNIHHIVDLSQRTGESLSRHEYITELGFRRIGEITFLSLDIIVGNQVEGDNLLKVTLDRNRFTLHLCRDSFGELLKLYSDFSFSSSKDTPSNTTVPPPDVDEAYYDAVAPTPAINLSYHTLEDYDPNALTQLNTDESTPVQDEKSDWMDYDESTERKKEQPEPPSYQPSGFDENPFDMQENISNAAEFKPTAKVQPALNAHANPFDGECDSVFDNIELDDRETVFDVPTNIGLDHNRQYIMLTVENESDIPQNAIRMDEPEIAAPVRAPARTPAPAPAPAPAPTPATSNFMADDFEFPNPIPVRATQVEQPKIRVVEPEPVQEIQLEKPVQEPRKSPVDTQPRRPPEPRRVIVPPHSESQFVQLEKHDDIKMEGFEFVSETADVNPIVRIRKNLVGDLQEKKIEDLPPMLGVHVETDYERKRRIENLLDLPEGYPKPAMQLTLRELNITIILHDGNDWNSNRQQSHNEKNKIEIKLDGLSTEFYLFNGAEKLSFRVGMEIRDISIQDKVEASNRNMLLSYDTFHLRAIGSSMINILMQQSVPQHDRPPHAMLNIFILPLRLNIDQDARYFITNFLKQTMPPFPPSTTIWDEIRLSDIDLQVDYKAKRLDGDLLNWCSINDAMFRLKGLVKKDVKDVGLILQDHILEHWWEVIKGYALGLGPLSPLVNFSKGFFNMFYQPYAQYQRSGRLLRGVKEGVTGFGVTLAAESLNIGSKVASGSQMVLQLTDDFLNIIRPESTKTVDERSNYSSHPENTVDGVQRGLDSLRKETNVAYRHLFLIPFEEFRNHGTGSAANAFLHAVPIAVIRPAIGIADGIKQVGLGARNSIEPKQPGHIYKN